MNALRLAPLVNLVALLAVVPSCLAADRPNILWVTAEDMSPNLGCYGDSYAKTPHIDRFARHAVKYTKAFATAPVCSPARSCLITGVYATSVGTQRLRSAFPIPARIRAFPAFLREAGYYTSNDVKTDYNTSDEPRLVQEAWDACAPGARWTGRRQDQPFFSVINLMTTHQSRSSVWSFEQFERSIGSRLDPGERHDPANAPLPPYYPDTTLARRTVARNYDCITAMDKEVGAILADLEADGLVEETIVFFYSDHGMGLPRGKRNLHDSGLHVPLLIRFPEKWRHLAPAAEGESLDRLVSFVDFAPTVLSLVGLEIPDYMQGNAFLGAAAGEPRGYIYGARDRVDEAFDVARSVRDGRWLYIRNYMPHLSWMQLERYSDQSDFRREFLELARTDRLGPVQLTYAAPTRPIEELYDTETDPHQIQNLAGDPEGARVLTRFRQAHLRWLKETRDVGFLPEAEAAAIASESPLYDWARAQRQHPPRPLLQAARSVGQPISDRQFRARMQSEDAAVRYWTVVGAQALDRPSQAILAGLDQALTDASASVRIVAAGALARQGHAAEALAALRRELLGQDVNSVLLAARTLEQLGPVAGPARSDMETVLNKAKDRQGQHPNWMFVEFALAEALERLAKP